MPQNTSIPGLFTQDNPVPACSPHLPLAGSGLEIFVHNAGRVIGVRGEGTAGFHPLFHVFQET